jgi:hypothetical protein
MKVWQADFYKRPLQDESGNPLWSLLVCDPKGDFVQEVFCPQSEANSAWLVAQLQQMGDLPDTLQVFRPQALSLLSVAGEKLGITVEPTRRTTALKQHLEQRATAYQKQENYLNTVYRPTTIEQAPPQALPDQLWGEEWRIATITAEDLELFRDRALPILNLPEELIPINLGLASTLAIPGVIIYGARQSLQLAIWLQEVKPMSLNYIPTEVGKSGGLVLEAGLADRWVVATFEDEEVAKAASTYSQRKEVAKGLHFLLVQPDDSGMTYTGFWLLRSV